MVTTRSMSYSFTANQIKDLEAVLSPQRFGTYLHETSGDRHRAMELYCWNTDISAAFYVMLQYFELAVRNGAVEAIEAVFGPNWHWNKGFKHTLPKHKGRRSYQPADDLTNCANKHQTAGKVVADLKFVFWQNVFVQGQDGRIWNKHFATAFPGYDKTLTIPQARDRVHTTIDGIRRFRNRIAHHEPIFQRNLATVRDEIRQIVEWRRPGTAQWLDTVENVTTLLTTRP